MMVTAITSQESGIGIGVESERNFLQFLVELQFYVITATATAVIHFSTTALEPQPRFLKIPQPKQEPQPRFS